MGAMVTIIIVLAGLGIAAVIGLLVWLCCELCCPKARVTHTSTRTMRIGDGGGPRYNHQTVNGQTTYNRYNPGRRAAPDPQWLLNTNGVTQSGTQSPGTNSARTSNYEYDPQTGEQLE